MLVIQAYQKQFRSRIKCEVRKCEIESRIKCEFECVKMRCENT